MRRQQHIGLAGRMISLVMPGARDETERKHQEDPAFVPNAGTV